MAESSDSVDPVTTRSSTQVWLVGQLIDCLDFEQFRQLPTCGQVLRRLFFDLKVNKLSLSKSCSNVMDEILKIWHAANIPTTQKPNGVSKLKALYQKHVGVGKNKARQTTRQKKLEDDFSVLMTKLFDISHANSDHIIRIEEDLQFLDDQRRDRKMIMGAEDQIFREKEEKREKRKHAQVQRQEKAKIKKQDGDVSVDLAEEADMSADDAAKTSTDDDEDELEISKYHRCHVEATATTPVNTITHAPIAKMNRQCLVDDPLFVASLDRTNTTPRQAVHIVAPALKAVGINVNDLTLCTTSVYEARKKTRSSIRDAFCPKTPLVVHFDSKLLPDDDGVNADCMAVVVSGRH